MVGSSLHPRRWLVPFPGRDLLILREERGPTQNEHRRVPVVFLISSLDAWNASSTRSTLVDIYKELGGSEPTGLTVYERARYDRQLKARLAEAFSTGELSALFIELPRAAHTPRASSARPLSSLAQELEPEPERTFIAIKLVDEDGRPIPGKRYRVLLPDGAMREGRLNDQGEAKEDGVDPGKCEVSFPDLEDAPPR